MSVAFVIWIGVLGYLAFIFSLAKFLSLSGESDDELKWNTFVDGKNNSEERKQL